MHLGFNGAMTLRPWRGWRKPTPSRGHRSFNGAMTLRSWRGGACRKSATRSQCFNGAMTLRSWRGPHLHFGLSPCRQLQWGHDLAVMESGTSRRTAGSESCFNGAMTLRSWREKSRPPPSRPRASRFNGAMTLRSWRVVAWEFYRGHESLLQWGHDLAVMESPLVPDFHVRGYGASMGP